MGSGYHDDVVVTLALDQLAPGIDAGASGSAFAKLRRDRAGAFNPRGLMRHSDADRLLAAADAVALKIERYAEAVVRAGREHADLDEVVHRCFRFVADAVGSHLPCDHVERHLVLAADRPLDEGPLGLYVPERDR